MATTKSMSLGVLGFLVRNRIYLGRHYSCSSVVMNAKGGKFPSVVWYRDGETIFEARLTNRVSGEYHGYALRSGQTVTGLN